jgi:hypothetical protein
MNNKQNYTESNCCKFHFLTSIRLWTILLAEHLAINLDLTSHFTCWTKISSERGILPCNKSFRCLQRWYIVAPQTEPTNGSIQTLSLQMNFTPSTNIFPIHRRIKNQAFSHNTPPNTPAYLMSLLDQLPPFRMVTFSFLQ